MPRLTRVFESCATAVPTWYQDSGGPLWQPDPWCIDIEQRVAHSLTKIEKSRLFDYVAVEATYKDDGLIANLKIAESSGSDAAEKQALDSITAAGRILPSQPGSGNIRYLVEFPTIKVTPETSAHADYRVRTQTCCSNIPALEKFNYFPCSQIYVQTLNSSGSLAPLSANPKLVRYAAHVNADPVDV